MTTIASARQYVEQLKARVFRCSSIAPEDRITLPSRFDETRSTWVVLRGFDAPEELFGNDPAVFSPLELTHGGSMSLHVRVREIQTQRSRAVEVVTYRLALVGIPDNPNNIQSLRFDKPEGLPRGRGWDEELGDNPEHPHAHVHFNFFPPGDNDCRMPTASVCPILLLSAFDYWYYTTFGS
ncbi:MAG: hypothetical protein ABIP48_07365 [Planctomycetota bacterium]